MAGLNRSFEGVFTVEEKEGILQKVNSLKSEEGEMAPPYESKENDSNTDSKDEHSHTEFLANIVISIAKGIVSGMEPSLLPEFVGHLAISRPWAQ